MKVLHRKTNEFHEAVIELMKDEDWEIIEKSGAFVFNWRKEKDYIVHKIRLQLEDKILGLISVEAIPKEYRLHIHLIESSNLNKGRAKIYDNIAGCLIAHTCEIAFEKNYDGFVSLKPKSEIVNLYKDKYGFAEMGQFLFTELENSERLIKKYLSHE